MKLFVILLLVGFCLTLEHWAVKLDDDTLTPQEFAIEHNLRYVKTIAGDVHVFEFDSQHQQATFHLDNKVTWAEKQVAKKQYKRTSRIKSRRTSINDPLYPSQWHLHRVNAVEAWNQGITGKNVLIGIVDDGLQHTHPDLQAQWDKTHSWDFNGGHHDDPRPESTDGHGTSAAGVAAAAQNNGHCGSGVAPGAKLAGIRLIAGPAYDITEAEALSHSHGAIKIYSCSWGPYDGGMELAGPGSVTQQVLKQGFEQHGSIYVWAGGNGRANRDNTNYDGYANSIYTIAIGAIDDNDKQSWYSESGACLFAVTPSSGGRRGVVTTDLMGDAGYSHGECTMRFGGTSSATPLAAGIIALILQKHPGLNSRQIQHIIASGSVKIHLDDDADWTPANVRGYRHSHKYGFGLMSVPELLDVEPLNPLPAWKIADSGYIRYRDILPREKSISFSSRVLDFIEQIEVTVSFYSNNRGDVAISLLKGNVESILMEKHGDVHRGLTTWKYTTVRHWGDSLKMNDKLTVRVACTPGSGAQLRGIQVKVYGF